MYYQESRCGRETVSLDKVHRVAEHPGHEAGDRCPPGLDKRVLGLLFSHRHAGVL